MRREKVLDVLAEMPGNLLFAVYALIAAAGIVVAALSALGVKF